MIAVLLAVAVSGFAGGAHADAAAGAPACLSARAMQVVVANKEVVAPSLAIRAARRAVPAADVLRANLCRAEGGLVYVVLSLRKDGRIVHVTIDAPSGKVRAVH